MQARGAVSTAVALMAALFPIRTGRTSSDGRSDEWRRATTVIRAMDEIEIRGDVIRLGQLLKLADVTDSGAAGKALLADGAVTVNGEVETRRGRQLHPGDVA